MLLYKKSLNENETQMAKILRIYLENCKAKFPKLSVFVGQKSILHHYYSRNVKEGIQIRVNKEEQDKQRSVRDGRRHDPQTHWINSKNS